MESSKAPITPSYDRVNNDNNGGNSSAPVAPAPAVAAPEPAKVEFTPEQQSKLDEIVKAAMGRAAADTRQRLSEAQHQLELTKAELERAQRAAAPSASADEKLAVELDAERRKNQELTATMQRKDRDHAALTAAQSAQFVDPAQALRLIDVPSDADAATVQAAIADLAAKNPHLVRGTSKSGSGSGPSTYAPQPTLRPEDFYGKTAKAGSADSLNRLSRSSPSAYQNLRSEARKAGLI